MNLWNLALILIMLGITAGHIAHIIVTGIIFEGLRRRIHSLGETRGGLWALYSRGFHCQLCVGVWVSTLISLWWTTGLYALYPVLWDFLAGRPLGWVGPLAWLSLFLVQVFFIAAIGHLFREIVGLVEDRRTHTEDEAQLIEQTLIHSEEQTQK